MTAIKPIGNYSGEFTVLQSGDSIDPTTLGTGTADATTFLRGDNTWVVVSGTVTSVSVVTANGVSGSVATASSTPAITLTLGAITPTSVAASGTISGSNLSGTNTGDQTITLTGDVTGTGNGSFAATIATNAVTLGKMAQVATSSILGRVTTATGNVEVLTATQVRTLLNVADGATANLGTVTSVGGTGTVSGLTLTGTVTTSGNLTLGGTLVVTASNFASQTANTFLSAPNGSAGVPTFRTIVAADIPTLNQNTTGSAATLTTGRTITLTGDTTGVSGTFNGSANLSFATTIADATVTGKLLTGWTVGTNASVAATDSILGAFGKIQGQIDSTYGGTLTGSYKFNTGTTAVDPTTGKLAFNNAAYASVTNIYISQTSDPGTDAENFLKALAVGDVIYVQERDNATKWLRGKISSTPTDNGTWWTLPITLVSNGAGTMISNNAKCAITVSLGAGTNGTVTSVGGTGTVNGLTLSGTVTTSGNLTLGGTLSGIGNAALTNSSVTIGSTAVSLGSTVTTFAGLTSVTSTTFVGALTGNASSATTVTTNANLTGPITSTGNATSVTANAITNAMLAQIPTANFHGRVTAATGNVENLTGTQATTLLDTFTSTLKGLAPASGGGTTNFLRADGTWTTPGGGTVTSVSVVTANGVSGSVATATSTPAITLTLGAITPTSVASSGTVTGTNLSGTNTGDQTITLTGDVTGSGTGSFAATIASNAVTLAKMAQVATGSILGRVTAATGNVEVLTAAQVRTLLNVADGATANLGTVTSVGGTGTVSGLTLTGTVTTSGNLTLGGTLAVTASNFASQTANFALIAPSGANGVPTFRALELSDIPDAWTKKSVRAATTANITLSGTQTIDTIAVVALDRVLVKNQTTTSQNGIYIASAGAWTRALGADTSSEIAGATVNVDSGTQGGYLYKTSFKSTDTLGTTGMVWAQVVDTTLAGTVVGATPGTAAIGTSIFYARQDHVHPSQTTITGNAGTATSLSGGSTGALPYQTGAGTTTFLTAGTTSQVLIGGASNPSWSNTPTLTGTNFSGIPNGALTNSSLTIGSTLVSLGATVTTFAGLTSVTSTTFVGALTGNASTVTTNANLTGPITSTGNATSVTANAITNAMLAQIPTANFHGRVTAATGNVENITGTQATTLLDTFTSALKGLAPASGGGTTNFLRADGTWTTPGGGGTVTSVSVVTANGVSGSVATATSTPAITLTLGAITPTSVAATGALSGTTLTVGSGTTTSDVIIAGAMNRDRAGALTTAAVTLVDLDTWAAATYRSAKYVIQAVDTVSGHVYFTEVMVTKDNSNNVYVTEYATVVSGTNIIALSADYDGTTNVRLRVTPASANSTQIKFRATIFNI